jgi:YegS/Rv2252/BmrU family lipid kinase
LAHEAASAGRSLVVAFGGDGTISEVTDGIVAAGTVSTALGIIPRGTGGDFRRLLALPQDVAGAARHLRQAQSHAIDVGRATYTTATGEKRSRHFINLASFGFSAVIARKANDSHKRLGAKLAYIGAAMSTLTSYENVEVMIRVDGGEAQRRTVLMAAIGNGSFAGGGMKVCPQSVLDDGLLDLVVIGDYGRFEVMRKISKVYSGAHLELEHVSSTKARTIEVTPVEGSPPIPIELDGETPGYLPATFEVVPRAITLRF